MNATIFLSTCRQHVVGRSHRLEEALRLAQERSGQAWEDLVIWKGTEVIAVVTAGGDVHATGTSWTTVTCDRDSILNSGIRSQLLLKDSNREREAPILLHGIAQDDTIPEETPTPRSNGRRKSAVQS